MPVRRLWDIYIYINKSWWTRVNPFNTTYLGFPRTLVPHCWRRRRFLHTKAGRSSERRTFVQGDKATRSETTSWKHLVLVSCANCMRSIDISYIYIYIPRPRVTPYFRLRPKTQNTWSSPIKTGVSPSHGKKNMPKLSRLSRQETVSDSVKSDCAEVQWPFSFHSRRLWNARGTAHDRRLGILLLFYPFDSAAQRGCVTDHRLVFTDIALIASLTVSFFCVSRRLTYGTWTTLRIKLFTTFRQRRCVPFNTAAAIGNSVSKSEKHVFLVQLIKLKHAMLGESGRATAATMLQYNANPGNLQPRAGRHFYLSWFYRTIYKNP